MLDEKLQQHHLYRAEMLQEEAKRERMAREALANPDNQLFRTARRALGRGLVALGQRLGADDDEL